jgi:hypothetical protein
MVHKDGKGNIPRRVEEVVRLKIIVVGAVLEIEPQDRRRPRGLADFESNGRSVIHLDEKMLKILASSITLSDLPMPASSGFISARPVILNKEMKGL